jgi:hypothetical protein
MMDEERLTVEQVRSAVSVPMALELLDMAPDRTGRVPCWHDGVGEHQTPSVQIDDDFWYCHRCGLGGDVIRLLQDTQGWSFGKVMAKLSDYVKANEIELDQVTQRVGRGLGKELHDFTAEYMQRSTSVNWELWLPRLKGVMSVWPNALGVRQDKDSGELLIPHWEITGHQIVGVKVRHHNSLKTAWPNSVFTTCLYGRQTPGAETVVIVEGESDCWAMMSWAGRADVLALPSGVQTIKDDWLPQLEQYKAIYLCFDNDRAGKQGREKAWRTFGWDRCIDLFVPSLYNDVREAVEHGWQPRIPS